MFMHISSVLHMWIYKGRWLINLEVQCLDIHVDCMDFIAISLVGQKKLNPVNENLNSLKSYMSLIASSRFMNPSFVYICAGYWNSTLFILKCRQEIPEIWRPSKKRLKLVICLDSSLINERIWIVICAINWCGKTLNKHKCRKFVYGKSFFK